MERTLDIQTPGVSGNAAHHPSHARAWSQEELTQFIDGRVNAVLEAKTMRLIDDTREARMKRLALYGGIGLAGAAVGTAVTLGVQRVRRNRAAAGPRVTVK